MNTDPKEISQIKTNQFHLSDNLDLLRQLPDNSIDSVVTDVPYGLGKEPDPFQMLQAWLNNETQEVSGGGFMGKKWDSFVPQPQTWKEVYRVLKPGGHVLAFFGTRTYDWGVMAMRIAGFEIRDRLQWLFDQHTDERQEFMHSLTDIQKRQLGNILKNGDNEAFWMYGSGFPKSLNIGKAIDKLNGRPDSPDDEFRKYLKDAIYSNGYTQTEIDRICGTNGMVGHWVGKSQPEFPTQAHWNTLKETLNLDDRYDWIIARVEAKRKVIGESKNKIHFENLGPAGYKEEWKITTPSTSEAKKWDGWGSQLKPANEPIVLARKPLSEKTIAANVLKWGTGGVNVDESRIETKESPSKSLATQGRFPANLLQDGSEAVLELFPETKGKNGTPVFNKNNKRGSNAAIGYQRKNASMFTDDKEGSLRSFNDKGSAARFFYCAKTSKKERGEGNKHPTVKPLKLMEYLVRLITPPNGIVLDPYAGSATTGLACQNQGFQYILIEQSEEYHPMGQKRLQENQTRLQQQLFPTS